MKSITTLAAVAALACIAGPAIAQEEPEQPRTTWRIQLINVKDDTGTRWEDIVMDKIMPAYQAAGLPVPQLHWAAMNDYEYVLITALPGGMGTFDHHQPAARVALRRALVASLGSEEAVDAMYEELSGYVEDADSIFTHTHP